MIKSAIIVLLLSVVCLASCGKHTKVLTKDKMVDKSVIIKNDHSVITTIEEIDTTLKTPLVEVVLDMVADTAADSVVSRTVKNDGVSLTIDYNKRNKKFTAKAIKDSSAVQVREKKTTIQQNNVETNQQNNIVTKSKHKQATHDYSLNSWIFGGAVVLIVIILLIAVYLYFRKLI